MSTFALILAASFVFLCAVGGMAVGVLVAGRGIQGSCGGLANMRDEQGKPMCMACEDMSQDCKEEFERREAEHRRAGEEAAV